MNILHCIQIVGVAGSGKLTCAEDDHVSRVNLRQGDVGSLRAGSVFYLQSNLEPERKKLRIYAIFANTDDNNYVSSSHLMFLTCFFYLELPNNKLLRFLNCLFV